MSKEIEETEKRIKELQQYEYNNDKIGIGEYVRMYNGLIGRVVRITEAGNYAIRLYDGVEYTVRAVITEHSKYIIDLIRDGDIVVLEYYVRKHGKRISRKFEVQKLNERTIYFDNRHCSFCYDLEKRFWRDGKGYNPKIKSIVTKEQFASLEYKI